MTDVSEIKQRYQELNEKFEKARQQFADEMAILRHEANEMIGPLYKIKNVGKETNLDAMVDRKEFLDHVLELQQAYKAHHATVEARLNQVFYLASDYFQAREKGKAACDELFDALYRPQA